MSPYGKLSHFRNQAYAGVTHSFQAGNELLPQEFLLPG